MNVINSYSFLQMISNPLYFRRKETKRKENNNSPKKLLFPFNKNLISLMNFVFIKQI